MSTSSRLLMPLTKLSCVCKEITRTLSLMGQALMRQILMNQFPKNLASSSILHYSLP
jgi:hypothetical protein